ncbi:discoidin domain-containing protein [Actinomadura macrotermitis]|uniref:3',5'-cyclic adenosine monophosphate phosphodiesterase CpdA n=1 Tax=Actinomadura macrotermitis TaxID=2585200 RepID=A0A7K0C3B5_9ACTN|nr:discoidin domain-containing protein [Actinomadura macrotermitis]MQY07908.1 3',5'-cyclic adenosine monophosphate phosphodiesterase CpdA [Actinomadura macrotermitis]
MSLRPFRTTGLILLSAAALALPATVAASAQNAGPAARLAAETLLSRGKPVTTSSTETAEFAGANAVDGSTTTRWASQEGHDPEWITIDLGAPAALTRVKLNWEDAYASSYRIDRSTDGTTWTSAYSTSSGDGGVDDRAVTGTARYVRVYGRARGTSYGYSLWEVEVYGTPSGPDTQAPSVPAGLRVTGTTTTSVSLGWSPSTDDTGVTGYDVLRDGAVVASPAGTSYTDTGLTTGQTYSYTVRARDAAGNVSAASAAVPGVPKAGETTFVATAAGDISEHCKASSSSCGAQQTAKRIEAINPDEILTLGDNQYDTGSLADYKAYYDTTWGRFKAKTRPVPGNHEYNDATETAADYKSYFGARATPQGKTYYSWERGGWHMIALDSELSMSATSAQIKWLEADLAANTKKCVAAYWHKPLYSSGPQADAVSKPAWQVLYKYHADLVLNGHDHLYERFAPQNASGGAAADGPRELLVGTGGASTYDFESTQPNSQKRITDIFGVLKLTLADGSYTADMVHQDGRTLDTTGPTACH